MAYILVISPDAKTKNLSEKYRPCNNMPLEKIIDEAKKHAKGPRDDAKLAVDEFEVFPSYFFEWKLESFLQSQTPVLTKLQDETFVALVDSQIFNQQNHLPIALYVLGLFSNKQKELLVVNTNANLNASQLFHCKLGIDDHTIVGTLSALQRMLPNPAEKAKLDALANRGGNS